MKIRSLAAAFLLGVIVHTEERHTASRPQVGIWQLEPGGAAVYVDASGHGDALFFPAPPGVCTPTFELVGVMGKVAAG